MKFLFFGDTIGAPARRALSEFLPKLRKIYNPDLVIANGENLAHGFGVSENSLRELLAVGVDFVTSGNHIFVGSSKEAMILLADKKQPLIRPLNWAPKAPGDGFRLLQIRTKKVLVVNLIGRVFMHKQHECPFSHIDKLLEGYKLKSSDNFSGEAEEVDAIIIDWHAEASSEKVALGWFLDGRVSAVLGTHTHVPTADARVLPQGTAHISDVGMCGPRDSILGMEKENILAGFLTQLPQKIGPAEGVVEVNYVFLETDDQTGLAKKIEKRQDFV